MSEKITHRMKSFFPAVLVNLKKNTVPAAARQFADVFTSLLGFEILMAGVPASTVVAVSPVLLHSS
jgi:hypothetical protein